MNNYITAIESIGLWKLSSTVPFNLVFLILLVELQNWIFNHLEYKVYVINSLKLERLDSKLRGFMYVEKMHLTSLWSYKAIKEQIAIL